MIVLNAVKRHAIPAGFESRGYRDMTAILDKVRSEGFEAGRIDANERNAQCRMAGEDDAYYRGQCDAWDDAPSRLRWFMFGATVAGITSYFL